MNTEMLIREREGDLFIGENRVLLRDIVTARQRGETPEQIQSNFPSLSLTSIYGAIVYYLEHEHDLAERFAEDSRALDEVHAANRAAHQEFFDTMRARFEAARQQPPRAPHPGSGILGAAAFTPSGEW